jgi:hypothetical protein
MRLQQQLYGPLAPTLDRHRSQVVAAICAAVAEKSDMQPDDEALHQHLAPEQQREHASLERTESCALADRLRASASSAGMQARLSSPTFSCVSTLHACLEVRQRHHHHAFASRVHQRLTRELRQFPAYVSERQHGSPEQPPSSTLMSRAAAESGAHFSEALALNVHTHDTFRWCQPWMRGNPDCRSGTELWLQPGAVQPLVQAAPRPGPGAQQLEAARVPREPAAVRACVGGGLHPGS